MAVTRYQSAQDFLRAAQPLLMLAEAENNLLLGIAEGLARNPAAAASPYLATVSGPDGVLACAVRIPPFKVVVTRANREPMAELARDAFDAIPDADAVTGPTRSASDFALAWSRLSRVEPTPGLRLRIHETRKVVETGLPAPPGSFRAARPDDQHLLTEWAGVFVTEAKIPERVEASRVVADAMARGRLHVWEDGQPVSMAAWTGKTPHGVRINFVYTPRGLRGRGYGTACVSALTRQQLEQGNAFCWLYTDLSSGASSNIFKRIGYWPVSDVAEYYLR